ncbi:serine/threonine-protein kinase [Frankia sp. AgPm24]|nr:serine/threonine-protein kinase [Frankia sp. AgPm24]
MTIDRARLAAGLPRFEIGELLGRGAFGAVFAARQRLLDRMVALKVLDLTDDDHDLDLDDHEGDHGRERGLTGGSGLAAGARARFAAESQLLASLDHPHVVQVFDGEEVDGLGVIIMELLPRGTVRARARAGPVSLAEICAVGIATAEALGYAHAAGVLHRDIKPANLMFAADDTPKVVDFGIAKIVENVTSTTASVAGTYPYMGPEIFGFGRPGFATDVYSLGVVLYELLTGRLPFGPRLTFAEYGRHHHQVPPPPMPDVPTPLADLVARILSKDASRRPTTRQLAVELAATAGTLLGPTWLRDSALPLKVAEDIHAAARDAQPPRRRGRGRRDRSATSGPTAGTTASGNVTVSGDSGSSGRSADTRSSGGRERTDGPAAPTIGIDRAGADRAGGDRSGGDRSGAEQTTHPSRPGPADPPTATRRWRLGRATGRPARTVDTHLDVHVDDPGGIAVAADGTVYVAQTVRHQVVRISPRGTVTLVAGRDGSGFAGDGGPAHQAALDSPRAVAVGPQGELYIADTFNNRIRRVTPDGTITTVLGGSDGFRGLAGGPPLAHPRGLAVDGAGTLFVADTGNHRVLRRGADGTLTRQAGTARAGMSGDGGPATDAELHEPHGLALGSAGRLYLADTGNGRLRRVDADGRITTLAGTFPGRQARMPGGLADAMPALAAVLYRPQEIAVAADGTCHLLDVTEQTIYRITPDLRLSRVGGPPAGPRDARGIGLLPDGSWIVADAAQRTLVRLG